MNKGFPVARSCIPYHAQPAPKNPNALTTFLAPHPTYIDSTCGSLKTVRSAVPTQSGHRANERYLQGLPSAVLAMKLMITTTTADIYAVEIMPCSRMLPNYLRWLQCLAKKTKCKETERGRKSECGGRSRQEWGESNQKRLCGETYSGSQHPMQTCSWNATNTCQSKSAQLPSSLHINFDQAHPRTEVQISFSVLHPTSHHPTKGTTPATPSTPDAGQNPTASKQGLGRVHAPKTHAPYRSAVWRSAKQKLQESMKRNEVGAPNFIITTEAVQQDPSTFQQYAQVFRTCEL